LKVINLDGPISDNLAFIFKSLIVVSFDGRVIQGFSL